MEKFKCEECKKEINRSIYKGKKCCSAKCSKIRNKRKTNEWIKLHPEFTHKKNKKSIEKRKIINKTCSAKRAREIGKVHEHYVIADLIKKGYQIFREDGGGNFCDMIACTRLMCLKIEVKTGKVGIRGNKTFWHDKRNLCKKSFDHLAIYFAADHTIEYRPPLPEVTCG